MPTENTFISQNSIYMDLKIVKELVYDKCDFNLTDFTLNSESKEYGACSFLLNSKAIQQRISKITPTKTGQFVTTWKRSAMGITEPFDVSDNMDFLIINARSAENFGQFIFPKQLLADKGIITQNGKIGKRGVRVYPPWDIPKNKQALKTQGWQISYFLTIKKDNSTDLALAKQLYGDKRID